MKPMVDEVLLFIAAETGRKPEELTLDDSLDFGSGANDSNESEFLKKYSQRFDVDISDRVGSPEAKNGDSSPGLIDRLLSLVQSSMEPESKPAKLQIRSLVEGAFTKKLMKTG